jgi:hypothetical protein
VVANPKLEDFEAQSGSDLTEIKGQGQPPNFADKSSNFFFSRNKTRNRTQLKRIVLFQIHTPH